MTIVCDLSRSEQEAYVSSDPTSPAIIINFRALKGLKRRSGQRSCHQITLCQTVMLTAFDTCGFLLAPLAIGLTHTMNILGTDIIKPFRPTCTRECRLLGVLSEDCKCEAEFSSLGAEAVCYTSDQVVIRCMPSQKGMWQQMPNCWHPDGAAASRLVVRFAHMFT
uniref:Uncharacterized protein n=1 Tax=Ascaris lumbricoides TaxID=6252 RepID=A0A9J2NZX7_ASCLU